MSPSRQSQYLGSEAFNQGLQINEHVNKNTGSLGIAVPLATLAGVSGALALDVVLGYRPGTAGVLGLPSGWDLGIPYIFNDRSLTTRGKTYVIDPRWESEGGVRSGLRYVNVKGVQLVMGRSTQRTPTGKAVFLSSCRYSDGITDYFDGNGRIVERVDAFGSSIAYAYTTSLGDALDSKLATITDSLGQTIRFDYGSSSVTVKLPDGTSRAIAVQNGALTSITGPLDTVIQLGYARTGSPALVESIAYPTGSVTAITYAPLSYRAPNGEDASFPAVTTLVRRGADRSILSSSRYSYGTRTGGNTFTGFAAGIQLQPDADALMDGGDASYRYDTIEETLDAEGRTLCALGSMFNVLHSPIAVQDLISTDGKAFVPVKSTTYEYPALAKQRARTTNYFLPIRTLETESSATLAQPVLTAEATHAYDGYGNVTVSQQYLPQGERVGLVPISERRHEYVEIDGARTMPGTTWLVDHVTKAERKLTFTLTRDRRSIASVTLAARPDGQASFTPYKTKSYQYDDQGRPTQWMLTWAEGQSGEGRLTKVGGSTGYAFDARSGRMTVTETDALGHETVVVFDARRPSAPVLSAKTPTGATASFTYDDLGRCTQWTDAMERITCSVYELASGTSKLNRVTTTGPGGYTTRLTYDGLGRLSLVEDNGDPTASGTDVRRTLRRVDYDTRGLPLKVTDELGLATSVTYDRFARPVSSTDPAGNVTTIAYDDATGSAVQSLNGDRRNVITANGLGEILTVETWPDSGDTRTSYRIRQSNAYDGFGQLVSETVDAIDMVTGLPTRLSRVELGYEPDGNPVRMRYEGSASDDAPSDRDVTVTATVAYDLLGNPLVEDRTVVYGSETALRSSSDRRAYDAAGHLVSVTNQLGQTEAYEVDADGNITKVTRYDGSVMTMVYNADGSLQSRTVDGVQTNFGYTPDGLVEELEENDALLSFAYKRGGTISSVTYPDGSAFTWEQDAVGRIVKQTDPVGGVATASFDTLGRFTKRTQGSVSAGFTYGTANHDKSALTGITLTGPATRSWAFEYDGFGDVRGIGITGKPSQNVLSAQYVRDARRNLVRMVVGSALSSSGAVNNTTRFGYDGLEQLVGRRRDYAFSDQGETIAYEYDGSGNVVASTVDGTKTAYAYDKANRISGDGITYDALGRLTADGLGNSFRYDAVDRLIAVETLGETLLTATYHPSGLLAQVAQGGDVTTFQYRGGFAQTVTTKAPDGTAESVSRLAIAGSEVAAVGTDGSATYVSAVNRSTALIDDGAQALLALEYDPFGSLVGDRQVNLDLSFLWNQEFRTEVAGLVYLRGRWYHPGLRQFLVEDPRLTLNRHGYSANPVDEADPLGESFFILGMVIAGIGTLVVGGLLGYRSATRYGADHFTASVGVGTVATTVGAVLGQSIVSLATTGTLTLSGLGPIALVGALAGVIGSGVGGILGRGTMRFTFNQVRSQRRVTAVGVLFGGVLGGLTGAFVAGGVMTLAVGMPLFGSTSAIAMIAGMVGGLGGGLLSSGAYLGVFSSNIIPVPMTESEVLGPRSLIRRAHRNGHVSRRQARRYLVMAYQSEANSTARIIRRNNDQGFGNIGDYSHALYLPHASNGAGGVTYLGGPFDLIAAHGCGRTIFVSVVLADRGNGGAPTHMRPVDIDLFVRYVQRFGVFNDQNRGSIKFLSCFANFGNAQTLANALQRPVWAGRYVVSSTQNFVWDRYDPE